MDFFDEMFNKTPKEKFIEIIQNGNLGALEKVFEEFLLIILLWWNFWKNKV